MCLLVVENCEMLLGVLKVSNLSASVCQGSLIHFTEIQEQLRCIFQEIRYH